MKMNPWVKEYKNVNKKITFFFSLLLIVFFCSFKEKSDQDCMDTQALH